MEKQMTFATNDTVCIVGRSGTSYIGNIANKSSADSLSTFPAVPAEQAISIVDAQIFTLSPSYGCALATAKRELHIRVADIESISRA